MLTLIQNLDKVIRLVLTKEIVMNSFSIQKLVENPSVKGARLVAGFKKANNIIYNVNIIDNPESYGWFTAGDFLLTTGYIYLDNPELQKQVIRELAEMNCAGIGIKIKRYWDEIPAIMIEEANKLNLPLVEIPFVYSLAQVSNLINNEIYKRENSLLKRYRNIHDVFSRCSLEGGDVWKIVKIVSELVGNPVLMLDSDFGLLSYYDLDANTYPLSEQLPLKVREKCFPRSFTETIPTSTDTFTLSIKRKFPEVNGPVTCRIIPIAHSNDLYGYLIVWETIRKLESIDYIALENAAQTAALDRIKTRQMEEARDRLREDFFDDLLQSKIVSVNAVKNLAKIHGMNPDKNYVVAVISVDDQAVSKVSFIKDIVQDISMHVNQRVQIIVRQNNIIQFIELNKELNNVETVALVKSYLDRLDIDLNQQLKNIKYQIGVSNLCVDFLTISKSFHIALDVLKISNKLSNNSNIYYFTNLIGYYLLDASFEKDKLMDFFRYVIGDLYEYDLNNKSDLLLTLRAYFDANGNLSEAAKDLFIHRNTFIYRLDKIKKILNTNLDDSEQNFNYQVALHIQKIFDLQ